MSTLILGYGNRLRRDDGGGAEVARRIGELAVPDLEAEEAHQLLPEHAELIARFERVVFVDASIEEGIQEVTLDRIEPATTSNLDPHASDPGALLALAGRLFTLPPEAWLIRLPVGEIGIGDALSEIGQAAVERAVALILARFGP